MGQVRFELHGVSIHTPVKGVTGLETMGSTMLASFDPHPREGGDECNRIVQAAINSFDPHPREGGDGQSCRESVAAAGFDPHPREGGD